MKRSRKKPKPTTHGRPRTLKRGPRTTPSFRQVPDTFSVIAEFRNGENWYVAQNKPGEVAMNVFRKTNQASTTALLLMLQKAVIPNRVVLVNGNGEVTGEWTDSQALKNRWP